MTLTAIHGSRLASGPGENCFSFLFFFLFKPRVSGTFNINIIFKFRSHTYIISLVKLLKGYRKGPPPYQCLSMGPGLLSNPKQKAWHNTLRENQPWIQRNAVQWWWLQSQPHQQPPRKSGEGSGQPEGETLPLPTKQLYLQARDGWPGATKGHLQVHWWNVIMPVD